MRTVNNHKQLLITAQAYEAQYPADGTLFTDAITAGTVAVVGPDNKVETGAVTGDYFWLIQSQGSGLPLIKSAPILKSTAKKFAKAYSAASVQSEYIGYNGTTYDLSDFTADEPIIIRNSLKSNFFQFQDKEIHVIGDFTPTSSDTEATVAAGLCKSLIRNSEKFVNIPFQVDRVHNHAGAAVTVQAGADLTHLYFVKGSKTVIGTNSAGVPYTGTDEVLDNISALDYLRAGTATTAAVYKVVSNTAGTASLPATLVLDVAYQGDTVAIAYGSTEVITAAQAAAGDFGIKLTGKARRFQAGVWRYETNKWITTVAGLGATVVTTTAASEGTGTYGQIAEDEWFYQLQEGMHQSNLIQVPPVSMRTNVASAGTYDQIEITWSDVSGGTDILGNPVHYNSVKVAVDNRTTAYSASALKTAIDANC